MTKEEMIQAAIDTLRKLYFEDVEFICGFIALFAQKKGLK